MRESTPEPNVLHGGIIPRVLLAAMLLLSASSSGAALVNYANVREE